MNQEEECGFFKSDSIESLKGSEDDSVMLPIDKSKVCIYFDGIPISKEMKNIFYINVCSKCKFSKMKFITKTKCKEEYLLTEEEISNFKFLTRLNPHKGSWNDMQLFIEEQIKQFSLDKYGSEIKIEEIKISRAERNKKSKSIELKKRSKK